LNFGHWNLFDICDLRFVIFALSGLCFYLFFHSGVFFSRKARIPFWQGIDFWRIV
jgi:hypothetical protein